MESRWYKKDVSLESPVIAVVRLPMSWMSSWPFRLIGPMVSKAIGVNRWVYAKTEYLVSFLVDAVSAALPAKREEDFRYVAASVSTTVTSQVRLLPLLHGISVRPSGRLPSVRVSPVGSFTDGISARDRA